MEKIIHYFYGDFPYVKLNYQRVARQGEQTVSYLGKFITTSLFDQTLEMMFFFREIIPFYGLILRLVFLFFLNPDEWCWSCSYLGLDRKHTAR